MKIKKVVQPQKYPDFITAIVYNMEERQQPDTSYVFTSNITNLVLNMFVTED